MKEPHLAIATVPMQEWGQIYDGEKALETGTIFEDLDMPFFAVESMHRPRPAVPQSKEEREEAELMKKLTEADFMLQDLTLYLDTHPDDEWALPLYKEKAKETAELKGEFCRKYYPLTRADIGCGCRENRFCWQKGPAPWEGVCV